MKFPEEFRITKTNQHPKFDFTRLISPAGGAGGFFIPRKGFHIPDEKYYLVIASFAYGWEHISVTAIAQNRCPTWEEMCYIKDLFFNKDETVVQYHPAEKDYRDCHPFCLHLWRPTYETLPVPNPMMIGPALSAKTKS